MSRRPPGCTRPATLFPCPTLFRSSAGTGMLAVYPTLVGAELMLNELAEVRADLLSRLFPEIAVSCHDAASINDRLPAAIRPTVVLMNPPFSEVAPVDRRMQHPALRHLASPSPRPAPAGRMVAIAGATSPPEPPTWDRAPAMNDRLPAAIRPTVVLMNPPFSAVAHVDRRMQDAGLRHIASALARLEPGGRLVAISGANCSPDAPAWRRAFVALQETARIVFTAVIDGHIYAKHGTSIDTRLTVIDKVPADDPTVFPASAGMATDTATLLRWVQAQVPRRHPTAPAPVAALPMARSSRVSADNPMRAVSARVSAPTLVPEPEARELLYETVDWIPPAGQLGTSIYEPYALQSLRIEGASAHPTPLVQSAAMASVAPPKPSYRPHLPSHLSTLGILSDAQLESVIYAGEAHAGFQIGRAHV